MLIFLLIYPYVELRNGLEVRGILFDVYISRYRNVRGQTYGFVRFANVRNIEKLSKALNTVYFGDFRMFANVARFDMFAKNDNKVKGECEGGKVGGGEGEKSKKVSEVVGKVAMLRRKEEFEKVKAKAVSMEVEREKKRARENEGVTGKVKVGGVEVKVKVKAGHV